MSPERPSLLLLLLGVFAFCGPAFADEECKCPALPVGEWNLKFDETVVAGFSTRATLKMKHRYNEVYYGIVRVAGFVPLQSYPMEFIGYLNGTSCEVRGSMAHVPSRLSIVFNFKYDGLDSMEGDYHRTTAFFIDDHFATAKAELERSSVNDEGAEFVDRSAIDAMPTT